MGTPTVHSSAWALAKRQHGQITHAQLAGLGFSRAAIRHRLARGRLHPSRLHGVYTVGTPEQTRLGELMAAVLHCGPGAGLSFQSAAELSGVRDRIAGPIEASIPAERRVAGKGLVVHRCKGLTADLTTHQGIPLTSPVRTLIDLATRLRPRHLEAAVNRADQLDLVDPESLRRALEERAGQPGVPALRRLLDTATFALTDSELERHFLPIAPRAGLPMPETQARIHGFRVDFHWPELGLVVETDGLRYHRTPAQQARDRQRDQVLTAHGLTILRFTHAQIRYEWRCVERALATAAARLGASLAAIR